MKDEDKLPLLKKSFKNLLNVTREEDYVTIVIFSGKSSVILPPTSCKETSFIENTIDSLEYEGTTDAAPGIKLACKTALKNYIEQGNNRIIMATGGHFQLPNSIYKQVAKQAKKGLYFTVFYFGASTAKLLNMEKLAAAGNGSFVHVTPGNNNQVLEKEVKAVTTGE